MQSACAPTVWIVDDDEDDLFFISQGFKRSQPPIPVRTFDDGDDLIILLPELIKDGKLPRLVLLDINMPRKNGFETLRELRATPEFATIPVVMISTSAEEKDRQRALTLGANHFLTKPHSLDQLQDIVQLLSRQWALDWPS